MNRPLLDRLFLALAAGDSLGSTSEFVDQAEMPALFARLRPSGWPFRQVGGGAFSWPAGAPTDDTDMARCLFRSAYQAGGFDGADVARRFVDWLSTHPPDVGATTRRTLSAIGRGVPWHEGGYAEFTATPDNAANGSLMRNGVVAGIAVDLNDALRISILQSVITHYAPLPVLCCAAQSFLIWELAAGREVLAHDWRAAFAKAMESLLASSTDGFIHTWRERVTRNSRFAQALDTLREAEMDPDRFSPFAISYHGRAGYCLLTLQIAVWAAAWARRRAPFPAPAGFPREPFDRTGPWVLAWVAMIGHDADTYGAAAGPLIAAAVGSTPAELTTGLAVATDVA
jgi:ADP-ribosylglycohydrolase